jgi:hypothetical protein
MSTVVLFHLAIFDGVGGKLIPESGIIFQSILVLLLAGFAAWSAAVCEFLPALRTMRSTGRRVDRIAEAHIRVHRSTATAVVVIGFHRNPPFSAELSE